MSDELKPCPFCGGAAHASLAAYASGATAHALCDGCGAAVLGYGRGERGLRDAVKRWNRRAERTCRDLNPPSCRDFECSECGESSEFTPCFMPNYCPNCGARVEEASDDADR